MKTTPTCDKCHNAMIYLRSVPLKVNGKRNLDGPPEYSEYGCAPCGQIVRVDGMGDELYEFLDESVQRERIWLKGDEERHMGWTVDLRRLTDDLGWAYQLTSHTGEWRSYSRLMHGPFSQRYIALKAAIIEMENW